MNQNHFLAWERVRDVPNPSSIGFYNRVKDCFLPLSSGPASLLSWIRSLIEGTQGGRWTGGWGHLYRMYSHSPSAFYSPGWTICTSLRAVFGKYYWCFSIPRISFPLLAVAVYPRLPQCMVLSSRHRQDIQLQGPGSGSLWLLIPEKKLSGMFRLGQLWHWLKVKAILFYPAFDWGQNTRQSMQQVQAVQGWVWDSFDWFPI